ncbi:hypothetical protein ACHWQZ_G019657 [Mnemiopsis leidyi]
MDWMQADGRSFMKIVNSSGPRILPCGTPESTLFPKTELPFTVCQLRLGSQSIPLRSRFPNPRSSPLPISIPKPLTLVNPVCTTVHSRYRFNSYFSIE